MTQDAPSPLGGFRILELAGAGGATFCGRLLAEFGAEVIKIEPPGGCETRQRDPFWNRPGLPRSSLSFLANNQGKKGITLDLGVADGRELLRALLRVADPVV